MLIKESQIEQKTSVFDLLDEATYLTQEETRVSPVQVSVREMSRFGEGYTMVQFTDVARLAEDFGVSYNEAAEAIAEANDVDVDKLTVAVDEADLFESPEMVDDINNIVVTPVKESEEMTRLCEAVGDLFLESEDESVFDCFLVESLNSWMKEKGDYYRGYKQAERVSDAVKDIDWALDVNERFDKKHGTFGQIPKAVTATLKTDIQGLQKTYQQFKDRPKNVIAKKIASLRLLYGKWMKKAQIEKNAQVASLFKRGALKVMEVIDKLLRAMQQAANKLSK